ncbi:calcium-binding protein [Methylorubrum extorquens]|uniref:calcium-binding protein n=1 Tax=Methylorubrum extorquens TaxID=408 RepID=UPI000158F0B5|nr:calcium-binding protein [Methylorubrum extorquens]ABY32749.1 Hemolysin-type calcium-binding region [Methylorubrum extorquens PA1]
MTSYSFDGRTTYTGTADADQFYMQSAIEPVSIYGLHGIDYVHGGSHADIIDGGAANDYLYGGAGSDSILGDEGDDFIYGGTDGGPNNFLDDYASDSIYGGGGSDTIRLEYKDLADGGDGDDIYYVNNYIISSEEFRNYYDQFGYPTNPSINEEPSRGIDTVFALNDYDLPSNIENLIINGYDGVVGRGNLEDNIIAAGVDSRYARISGDDGSDLLIGSNGNDYLFGGTGNDTLAGESGSDTMYGNAGDDTYSVNSIDDVTNEAPGEGYDVVYASVNYGTADNIEALFLTGAAVYATGNAANNALIGNELDNVIDAGAGTFEFINGAGGNDLLIGGAGHDEIMGGAGNDVFRFTSPSDAGDFFYDFTPGQDKIQLNAAAFGIGTAANQFITGVSFIEGPDVTSSAPTVLYNKDNGYLLYDADGTGAAGPSVLAILNGTPTLHASDFLFY